MSVKKWMLCVDGTSTLKEGEKYLIECRGTKAKVIRDQHNPHRIYGNIVLMSRFRTLNPSITEVNITKPEHRSIIGE